jgi:hypothetical protein
MNKVHWDRDDIAKVRAHPDKQSNVLGAADSGETFPWNKM